MHKPKRCKIDLQHDPISNRAQHQDGARVSRKPTVSGVSRNPLSTAIIAMIWALFSIALPATAGGLRPDRVYMPLATHHVNLDPADYGRTSWNEFNPGVVLTWEKRLGSFDYSLGAFRNSYDRMSAIATVARMWDVGEHIALGGFVGFADYGADARYFDVTLGDSDLVVIPGLQVNYRNLFGQVIISPQPGGAGAILSMGATFPLSR